MAGSQSNSGDTDADVQEQLLNYPSERNTSKRAETISPGAKFTAEHLMRHCPYTVTFDYINPSLWGVPAPEDADETHATTWVAKAIHDYHVGMEWDERLYFDYQWDFEGWTRELFQKVERTTLRSLKTVLRYRGVYTGKFRARVADSLFNLLGGENAPEWDPAEFKAEKFDERSEAYQRQQNAHLAAPIDRQAQQPLQQTQPLEPLQPQPQRPSQGEQYRVRQGVRSHPQYQELQQPPYAINAYAGPQPRQTEQAMQPQQWYPQAQTTLKRTILAHLPTELVHRYPEGTILHVIKPLYGIAEAGVHWWTTYHGHHCKELDMSTSTYDPCLLITNSDDADVFGIVGMQTDDTLMLGTTAFLSREEKKIQKAQFRSKPKAMLTPEVQLDFNGCTLTMDASRVLILRQKGQGGRIRLVDIRAPDRAQQYTEQRARGAYIASTCQPEASFDLSVAAQAQQPSDEDIKALNKRLKWQMENLTRGLRYVTVNLTEAKLIVFVDGSFANNKDLSSQLGFVLMLVNESIGANTFTIQGNVIHYSSTKCKRITRSVLASEIYGMVNGFDIGIAVATTLRIVTERLGLPAIPLVICTDSYSLYECLVKLGTTKEKRLMIDIMALRQSYERREITEIRWINGEDNPADAFTKASPNRALERFIDGNKLTVRVDGWVQRPTSFDV
ncbi:DUF1421 multi-domain protein [Pyrenophora tritici-repentis]|uniref:DUF1421 multi-domain protein n=1 Tax=Pyrenophora tritici-repentis TaxID=45151 RepID=A0A834S7B2_9PLEO|nr:DUF1421 multi-domain protein [Pyrenophora tritici-repentis]